MILGPGLLSIDMFRLALLLLTLQWLVLYSGYDGQLGTIDSKRRVLRGEIVRGVDHPRFLLQPSLPIAHHPYLAL